MTWVPPKKFYIRCVLTFHEAFLQSQVLQGPSHPLPLTGQLQRRSALVMGGNLLRPRKVRAQPQAPRALGPSCPLRILLLKRRQGKERSASLPSALLPAKW